MQICWELKYELELVSQDNETSNAVRGLIVEDIFPVILLCTLVRRL